MTPQEQTGPDSGAAEPIVAAAGRGAVDLSAMTSTAPPTGGAPAGPGRAVPAGLVKEVGDATFTEAMNATLRVPAVLVLWSSGLAQTRDFVDDVVAVAATLEGRLQVLTADVDSNPQLLRAFQVQSVPVTVGLLQGQPVPLFAGAVGQSEMRGIFDQLLQLAVQHGVTGRVELGPVENGEGPQEVSPHHEAAFAAIEAGDWDGAQSAYEQALAANPNDEEATAGLAQVGLLRRTADADLNAARQAAADDPTNVEAAALVADLDLLGGHVDDAFGRLLDLVRATSGAERDRAKDHLLELLAVVGNHDERVRKARTALMSALF